jgi:hypothetical protein
MAKMGNMISPQSRRCPNALASGRVLLRNLEPHLRQTLLFHTERSRRPERHIDNAAPLSRLPILDRHPRYTVVRQIGHLDEGPEGQSGAGGRRPECMERLPIRHAAPVLTPTIPARGPNNRG